MGDRSVGLLSKEVEQALLEHLDSCAECAREGRRFEYLVSALDTLPRPEPPAELWLGVRARLDLERVVRANTVAPVGKRPTFGWAPALLTTAAGFVVALGLMSAGGASRDVAEMGLAGPPATVSVAMQNTMDARLPTLDATTVTAMDSFTMRPLESWSTSTNPDKDEFRRLERIRGSVSP